MQGYNSLINKLDGFIRKYYTNKLIRGLMVSISALLALYLILSVGEYHFYFSTTTRYVLDFIFIGIAAFALIAWIIIPLAQLLKLGKVISHNKAAEIIGTHFPNVQDKLLNVLQLKQQSNANVSDALLLASIDQRTKELQPIPFQKAIDLTRNRKYLKFLLPPVIALLILLLVWPAILTEGTARLIQPNKKFAPKAPFTFKLVSKKLSVAQYDDFELQVTTEGKVIPERMNVVVNGHSYDMVRGKDNVFTHKFLKVPRDQDFNFSAGGFSSEVYKLKVLMRPAISNFKVYVDYPDYTGNKDEILDNMGDIVAPQGTNVRWVFNTANTDNVYFKYGDNGGMFPIAKSGSQFTHSTRFMRDTTYSILVRNQQIDKGDSLHYSANIIPDQSPSINVTQYADSTTGDYVLFVGDASDDYGIARCNLVYSMTQVNDQQQQIGGTRNGSIPISLSGKTFAQFNHMFDIESLSLKPGTKLKYYFEVWDNDAVNGSKSARSQEFTYERPTLKQIDSLFEEKQEEISRDLSAGSKQSEKIEQRAKELQEKILEQERLTWEDKKQIQELLQQQQQMLQNIEQVQEKFKQNNQTETKQDYSEQIKERQDELERMMDDMLNEDMRKKLDKLQELMERLSKEELFQELQQLEQNQELQRKDFERLQSLMNDLERDMRMEDLANRMRDLAKKQLELQRQNEQGTRDAKQLEQSQDALNKEFEQAQQDMKEIEDLNNQSESPKDMEDIKDAEQQAQENMETSSKQLKQGDKKSASAKQKKAQEKLDELSQKLREAAEGPSADQMEIDIKATRQILTNLIRLSFAQEKLIDDVRTTPANNPQYVGNVQVQQKLRDDSKMIADSLFALSKRVASLSSIVNKEVDAMNRNMSKAIEKLEYRSIGEATASQQYVMTNANNLALMLNELLQQLLDQQNQEQNSSSSSSGSCSKPGKKKGKGKGKGQGSGEQLSDIITQQQKLGGALQQLLARKQAGGGKQPGGKDGKDGKDGSGGKAGNGKSGQGGQGGENGQSGKDGKSGQGGSGAGGSGSGGEGDAQMNEARELAQIAAQQAALRKQLNDINQQLLKQGTSIGNKLKDIQQDMDRNETDIVNRRITEELIRRQSTILSRLLEAKEAIREQDQGDERQSNAGKEMSREIPASLQKILRDRQSAIDYYRTVPPDLKPYYKNLVEQYFGTIK